MEKWEKGKGFNGKFKKKKENNKGKSDYRISVPFTRLYTLLHFLDFSLHFTANLNEASILFTFFASK